MTVRVGLISDTHGSLAAARRAWRAMTASGPIECLLHAGDYIRDARALAAELPVPVYGVRGNNDLWDTGDDQLTIEIGGITILLIHGHRHGVARVGQPSAVVSAAKGAGAEVAVFGHSHVQLVADDSGVLLINPGSPIDPRGGHLPSCAVLTIADGQYRAEIIEL